MRLHTRAAGLAVATVAVAAAAAMAAPAPPPPGAPYLAEVRAFAFNFCPSGWLPADGRQMPIAQNQALFSLLGTTYGGNGMNTFALPDLRGRAPLGTGQGVNLGTVFSAQPGSPPRFLGMTWCLAVQGAYPGHGLSRVAVHP
jgi:microcystin-dependent protein